MSLNPKAELKGYKGKAERKGKKICGQREFYV